MVIHRLRLLVVHLKIPLSVRVSVSRLEPCMPRLTVPGLSLIQLGLPCIRLELYALTHTVGLPRLTWSPHGRIGILCEQNTDNSRAELNGVSSALVGTQHLSQVYMSSCAPTRNYLACGLETGKIIRARQPSIQSSGAFCGSFRKPSRERLT